MISGYELSLKDFVSIAPLICLFLGSLLPITYKIFNQNKEPNPIIAVALSFSSVFAALVTSLILFRQNEGGYFPFGSALVLDGVAALSFVVITVFTGITILYSRDHKATLGENFSEYLFLLLNAAMGMMLLAAANDLIVMFIAIEVMSLCVYLAIALSRETTLAKEAAFKYFVLGSFASAIFLYGVAFIYGVSGTTYLSELAVSGEAIISFSQLFVVGIAFVVVGFAFKAALVPFHSWAPDVYQGSPTPVTGYMSAAIKFVTFIGFLRFLKTFMLKQDPSLNIISILEWLAVLTMIVGNIGAILQNNIKRMLAYSSVAHSGYVLMGLIASTLGGESWRGDASAIYYALTYGLTTLGAFGIVSLLEKHEGDIVSIDNLQGLAKRQPVLAAVFSILLLSLAGIPPLVGFFAKLFVFSAVISQGLYWLAVWGAVSSIVGVYYYLRPIVVMYMKEEQYAFNQADKNFSFTVTVSIAILAVLLGLIANPLYNEVRRAIVSFI